MCSKTSTGKSTPDFSAQIEKLKQALKNAGIDEVIAEKQRQLDAYIEKTQ